MDGLNRTHDATLRSSVASANVPGTDFPIQNLPLGSFSHAGAPPRGGVAIGDMVLDLSVLRAAGLFGGMAADALDAAAGPTLNPLMALGGAHASALRGALSDLLSESGAARLAPIADAALLPAAAVRMVLPAAIGSFTDFLTSIYHTERGGRAARPDQPVPLCFRHLPVAYNSRASSVRASGEAVARPNAQWQRADGTMWFGPTEALDFELEVGAFIGPGNPLGMPLPIGAARDRLFGYCLVNDWSARDLQRWESALGPFLCKSFSTTISPWVVTAEAMLPFRIPAFARPAGDPAPLPYLDDAENAGRGGMNIALEALLVTPAMRAAGAAPARVALSNFRHVYWTFAQMATHHMSNGCNLSPGDLIASGTVSGPTDDSRACLAEMTVRGTEPVSLPNGETRGWLHDGDEVIFRARAEADGFIPIGFGECRGRVDPAPVWPVAG
jgi:fumarylacetoacetase